MAKNNKDIKVPEIDNIAIKPCFIITPIGEANSPTNLKAKGLINSVIEPILAEFGFEAWPAYKMADSGSINRQVLKSIISNELVIANLTGLNPNVMYELAVRHAVRLPVIIMAEENTKLPFDINDQRTIFYSDTLLGSENAKPLLRAAIEVAVGLKEKNELIDNPIYQVYEEISIIKSTKGSEQTVDEYLLKRFDRLENAISRMSKNEKFVGFSSPESRDVTLTLKSLIPFSASEVLRELTRLFGSRVFVMDIKEEDERNIYQIKLTTAHSNGYLNDVIEKSGVFNVVDLFSVSFQQ